MHLQVSSFHWGQRWSLKAAKRAHTPQTIVIVDTSFGTFQSVRFAFCVLNIKPLAENWSTEKMLRIFTINSSNKLTRGSIIQAYKRRKVLDMCHTRDSTLNFAHLNARKLAIESSWARVNNLDFIFGDWPYQRADSCHFSTRIEQIDKSESCDVCQQLPPRKAWQAPFLWPTFSGGPGTTYNLLSWA